MTYDIHHENKQLIGKLRTALYDCDLDLLHVYRQLGVDVFSRMREITCARQPRM